MDALTLLLFVGGLGLLVAGAEWLVQGASALARAIGLSPLVIGLTVVAFGTSAPELAVSLGAALAGESDLALGNVVGSNIANVLLILGASAAIVPLVVAGQVVRREVPVMIGVSCAVVVMSLDGTIGRLDGTLLVSGLAAYLWRSIVASRRAVSLANLRAREAPEPDRRRRVLVDGARAAIGLGLLLIGTRGVVAGATSMAESMGVSQLVIGLTVVAIGTSLPEGATSIIAALRGQRDLAVGNAVGSNIFNLLLILGLTAVIRPIGVPEGALAFDLPMMLAVAAACLPVFFTGGRIGRWEGWMFLTYYGAYLAYLVLDATSHEALPTYRTMMLAFVLPLTTVTLLVLAIAERGRRRRAARR